MGCGGCDQGGATAIELPDEVVSFLQFIGVNWPSVNEDKVREFPGGGAGESFSIHPEEMHKRAELLRGHARTVASHAADFESKAAGVSFE
ncbi:hypothetical protein [Streptomyces sp. NPDC059122]|nr:hypothetical protein CG747_16910 [Streptomyces sp. CB02959]